MINNIDNGYLKAEFNSLCAENFTDENFDYDTHREELVEFLYFESYQPLSEDLACALLKLMGGLQVFINNYSKLSNGGHGMPLGLDCFDDDKQSQLLGFFQENKQDLISFLYMLCDIIFDVGDSVNNKLNFLQAEILARFQIHLEHDEIQTALDDTNDQNHAQVVQVIIEQALLQLTNSYVRHMRA